MTRQRLDAPPKCPACSEDLPFWQSARKRCIYCNAPLKLDEAKLLVWGPVGAFFGAAILAEIPLHILGGAWPLLAVPVGVLACVIAWWATWRSCIAVAREDDA